MVDFKPPIMRTEKILIVDDDPDIAEVLKLYLSNAGYMVDIAHNSSDALENIRTARFDLILLDIMLPDFDGTNLCKKIRKSIYCPIIFISCIDDENQILNALEIGGDDYIKKPFNPKEVVARIKSNLRRVSYDKSDIFPDKSSLTVKDLTIDLLKYTVKKQNIEISLSPIEFDILLFMFDSLDTVLSSEEIYKHVWKSESLGDIRTVMVHISNLRKKLEYDGNTKYIKTVKGKGYMFLS